MSCKVLALPDLIEKIGAFPREKKVVHCHGVFDVCHPGHIRHLTYAKSKADILVVSLTADRHIKKGKYRPHVPQDIRAESLAALEVVDYVVIDDNPTPIENILVLKPDYFAKGYEYSNNREATGAENATVQSYGGSMIFTPGDIVYSSTKLLNTHLPKLHIEKLINLMKQFNITFDDLRNSLKTFSSYKIHVVGDTIIDTYTRTNLIGSNAKTPTFSVLYDGHEDYVGGAGVVAQHLRAAGADVTFTTVLGNDTMGKLARADLKNDGIVLEAIVDENRPTTHKNVIISGDTRMLKIDTVDNTPLNERVTNEIANVIGRVEADAVIFSDFRHGIFNKYTLPVLISAIPDDMFKVADSQVASRWGNITEFLYFDLITPNEKEARFALGDQDSNIGSLISETKKRAAAKNVILKLGSRGTFFLQDDLPYSVDSFVDNVKDAVGAGDALLAYATLTMLATKSLPMACIMGSIAAACECEVDGNMPITPETVLDKLNEVEKMI